MSSTQQTHQPVIAATRSSQHECGTCGGPCGGLIRPRTTHGADSHHESAAQRQDVPTQSATGGAGTPRHLHTLQGKVGTTDEAAKPQTNQVISDTLSKILEQYNNLSEIAPSRVVGGKPPSRRQLSFFRRAFLLYNPHTFFGWTLHTLFYMIATIFVFYCIAELSGLFYRGTTLFYMGVYVVVFGIPLLILQRLARRNAAQSAAQLEESDGT